MANYRVSFYYGQAQFGWSETWWRSAGAISDLAEPIQTYLNYKRALMSVVHSFVGVRIAIEGVARTGKVLLYGRGFLDGVNGKLDIPRNGARTFISNGNSPTNPDQVRAALIYNVEVGGRVVGRRYWCGIPDNISLTEPQGFSYASNPDWWDDWHIWADKVKQSWTVKVQSLTGDGTPVKIANWTKQADGAMLITAKLPIGSAVNVVQGNRVVVTAARTLGRMLRSPNGTWIVESVVAGTTNEGQSITLLNSGKVDPKNLVSLGSIRKQVFEYPNLTLLREYDLGTHKRGRPFRVRRGRTLIPRYVG